MFNRSKIFAIGFLLLLSFGCVSQVGAQVEIKAIVDKNKLDQSQALTLSIDIAGQIKASPKIELPELNKDFQILSSSQSQNISLKGRQTNLAIKLEYILLPKKAGKLTIGPVQARYKNKVYKTEPINIEVLPSERFPLPELPSEETPSQEEETVI